MTVLYVKEQGAIIQKQSERILISKNRKNLLELPLDNIEGITVIGNIQITAPSIRSLMEKGIDISYFSFSGKYLGSTTSDSSKNIFLRLAQYNLYQDLNQRTALAKKIVLNKISNQIQLLHSHRWENDHASIQEDLKQLELLLQKAGLAGTSNELMGFEGKASNIYFQDYGKMFKCNCQFSGRNRRPPRDPINVIISLGYTFLTKEVSLALESESFEMYLGFLHGIRYGRKSLPLDIVEEFRQPIVDRMVLKLFNKRMIQEFDFSTENSFIHLNEEGFQKFCREFERWMTDPEISGEPLGYRGIIQNQARSLKYALQKKGVYEPYCLKKKNST